MYKLEGPEACFRSEQRERAPALHKPSEGGSKLPHSISSLCRAHGRANGHLDLETPLLVSAD